MKAIRVIGIDDSPFSKGSNGKVLVVGVGMRKNLIEGVLSTYVEIDGNDATDKIIEMIKRSKFGPQSKIIMINGIALAGFNVIDLEKLSEFAPTIIVSRKKANYQKIREALKHVKNGEKKFELILKAGKQYRCEKVYFQTKMEPKLACKYIKEYTIYSNVPEPIRIAHMIGSGVILGESRQRV